MITANGNFYKNTTKGYYCKCTGETCPFVQKHFDDYEKAIAFMAVNKINSVIYTDEIPDLCSRILNCKIAQIKNAVEYHK
jgi:hypothetical protein